MSDSMLLFWALLAMIGFAGSALYSGMETGAYSLNRIRLHVLVHRGNPAAKTLHNLLSRPTALLTTLLIGNNITNYLGVASMGVIIESKGMGDWQAMALNTLIVTPILFVVGETLPKDLFAAYSDRLMYRLVPVLNFSRTLFTYTGLAPLIGLFSNTLMKAIGQDPRVRAFHPRRQVGVLVREGVGYGLLSQEQSAIVDRVLDLADRRVADELTAWNRVEKIRSHDSTHMVWRLARRTTHSHVPVLNKRGEVVGVLRINDALANGRHACPSITDLMKPAHTIGHQTPVREALDQLKRHTAGLAVVTGASDQPIGVVTVKDLIEPITGDLAQW
jgi:magnesium and cobalt exporter, CNNM family